ncbi:MAG TPA: M14 family metallopeptidase [Vicinamibacterales bacterium]|nr:M14 family metallopeptidase [Vicinamibacterales bacterium]
MLATFRSLALFLLALTISADAPRAQTATRPAAAPLKVTAPEQFFGHPIGADYVLPNYTKFTEYVRRLDAESDRMIVQSIGKTAEGRDQLMAIITAPENFKRLDRYQEIARRLSRAEGLTDDQARALANEGKAVIWIDGGLHATEVLGAQQLIETIYQFASKTDDETMRILRDVIILAAHANPDGMELVSDWYMRNSDPRQRSTSGIPRLYQKYVGHDNNRDFYMMNQPESENINRVLYRAWFPQIVYNHHQTGPTGTVMFSPPFRDPFNYVYDPLVVNMLDQVGSAMHARFDQEGKPGVTTRSGSNYSTWWNGGLRTMPYFHNQIGLLTETIGNPTPEQIGFVPDRLLARGDLPSPIPPQTWHFRQSIDYSITANYAVLDFAQRYRETLLYNTYVMGRNAIRKGSTDTWTTYPRRIAEVKAEIAKAMKTESIDPRTVAGGRAQTVPTQYYDLLRRPEWRDPRAYILPADAGDFLTATKFVNIMIKSGLTAERATSPLTVAGKTYPAGSYVFKAAQAYRPHLLDMFEPQDHPNDLQYPGGPPLPPYDNSGWTLAYQMGLKFDRVFENVEGPLERLADVVKPAAGQVTGLQGAVGFTVPHRMNDAFIAVNRLLKAGEEVFFVADRSYQSPDGTGVMFITARPSTTAVLQKAAVDFGLTFSGVTSRPAGTLYKLTRPRIALWDQYGGSMPSGHVRWLLEQFEFDFDVVYPPTLDAGNLKAKYDVILFPDGGIPEADRQAGGFGGQPPRAEDVPAEYRDRLGRVTIARTVPQLKRFVEQGGVVVAFGGSAVLGHHLGLPVDDHLVESDVDGSEHPLPRTKYYIPGAILQVAVDNTNPLAFGLEKHVDVFFDNSPVMELAPDATLRGLQPVAWFDRKEPLRSGWAWGQHYLEGGTAAVEAMVGQGRVFLFGPEITFRAQPHGTFKFLFNSIYYATAQATGGAGRDTATPGQ